MGRMGEKESDAEQGEQHLADEGELRVGNQAGGRRRCPQSPAAHQPEGHDLPSDSGDRQHAVHRFADPDQVQHSRKARPVRTADQRLPVLRIGHHRDVK